MLTFFCFFCFLTCYWVAPSCCSLSLPSTPPCTSVILCLTQTCQCTAAEVFEQAPIKGPFDFKEHLFCLQGWKRRRHTDVKVCVDRTGSIPTVRRYINPTCWNGKYVIDRRALVLYSNISNEWRNKRGSVQREGERGEQRGAVQTWGQFVTLWSLLAFHCLYHEKYQCVFS